MNAEPPQIPPNLLAQMEGPPYMGPTTFAKCVGITEPEELDHWKPDIAIVGAPWDDSTTVRSGARHGPRAVRVANNTYPYWSLSSDIAPLDYMRLVDYGDAMCPPGMVDAAHEAIRLKVAELATRRIVPIIIGGDHSITYPAATAIADEYGHGKVGIVHFDAHADTVPEAYGNLRSHGTPMRRLIESGAVPGRNFVQVGLHGYWPPKDVLDWMDAQQMRTHRMEEIRRDGFETVIERAVDEALDGADYIYISVDIDVIDPGLAPGTGAPEPGGLLTRELLWALQEISQKTEVVAMDMVEVSPPLDTSDVTSAAANRLILEVITGLAVRKRARLEGGNESGGAHTEETS